MGSKHQYGLCCLGLVLVLTGCGGSSSGLALEWETVAAAETAETQAPEAAAMQDIFVYVCGAVKEPGVVRLPQGSRADDAVKAAGGLADDADSAYVNLAALVADGEKLLIPTVAEAGELEQERILQESTLVNINTADVAGLCTLPGIGESRAADIIAYREQNGSFEVIEDIMKVSGIKTGAFQKICDRITVK